MEPYEDVTRIQYVNKNRTKEFEDFLLSKGLLVKNLYNVNTFKNCKGENIINLIITSRTLANCIKNVAIHDNTVTPHPSVFFKWVILQANPSQSKHTMHIYYEVLEEKLTIKLLNKYQQILDSNNPENLDHSISEISSELTEFVNKLEEILTRSNKEPWWTPMLQFYKILIKRLNRKLY